ncbi:MAG: hypothetical protein ACKOB3_00240 [Holophagaceae bacterium]
MITHRARVRAVGSLPLVRCPMAWTLGQGVSCRILLVGHSDAARSMDP